MSEFDTMEDDREAVEERGGLQEGAAQEANAGKMLLRNGLPKEFLSIGQRP